MIHAIASRIGLALFTAILLLFPLFLLGMAAMLAALMGAHPHPSVWGAAALMAIGAWLAWLSKPSASHHNKGPFE